MVEVNSRFPFVHRKLPMEVAYGRGYPTEAEQGRVETAYAWTDRQPHPTNMSRYEEWANDPEANIAFTVLAEIIAGVGYYTEMPDQDKKGKDIDPEHRNKEIIDEYGETVNLDEDLYEITLAMLQKGFCPVERLADYDLKILPPETFYIWRDKKGHVYRYTQERSYGDVIATWEDPKWKRNLEQLEAYYPKNEFKELLSFEAKDASPLEDIILFFNDRTTSRPYGKSFTEPIGSLLDDRAQMNKDMPKAVHRWAYPIPFMWTKGSKDNLQKTLEERDADDWVFIGNVMKEEFGMETVGIDPQARFIPYIELIYYQICEGLHAPLLLYLKNATEASATVMMESVDRLVNGKQRYLKRRVERFLFEPQVGDPVPRLVWGQPKTGLEEITLTDVAAIFPYLAPNQQQDLLSQLGIQLEEPEWPKPPPVAAPTKPFEKPKPFQEVPIEQMIEKLNDLGTSLNVIETNYKERKITLTDAVRLGDRTISVHMKRAYGDRWQSHREERFQEWVRLLMGVKEAGPTYRVTVED